MKSLNDILKNLKKDFSGFQEIKVALLGDSSTQFIKQTLRGLGYEAGIDFSVYESNFGQIEQEILDSNSDLYKFSPEFVIIYKDSYHAKNQFYRLTEEGRRKFAEEYIQNLDLLLDHLYKIRCKVIWCNLSELNDNVFGNYASKIETSLIYQIRKINFKLMELSASHKQIYINDISLIQNRLGEKQLFDPVKYYQASLTLNLDCLPAFTRNIIDIIKAIQGKINKCIILDLDNTLWGGIIGDDGIENIQIGTLGIGRAFSEFQLWLKQLKERGIILAVCSKNSEDNARLPFTHHPEMILKLEDFAIFVANWESKVDNIRHIQEVLNIGFDSMIFLDDSPYERNLVRGEIPDVIVPELPEDPVEYLGFLQEMNLFETASYSAEDSRRTLQYQAESRRRTFSGKFTDSDDYLKGLEMCSNPVRLNNFTIPRVSQLTQRSNQFNLRTIRYTEEELTVIMQSKDKFGYSFSLTDRFGDNGIVSAIILEKTDQGFFIDTWIMSCRVLKRGLEFFVLDYLVQFCLNQGMDRLIGEYIPTSRNNLVKDHYKKLGFRESNSQWVLPVARYKPKPHHIKLVSE